MVTLAASANSTGNDVITLSASDDIVVTSLTGIVLQSNARVTDWGGTVQINFASPNLNLFNGFAPFHAVVGTAENPFILPAEMRLTAQTTITVYFVNDAAGTATDVYLCLVGYDANA